MLEKIKAYESVREKSNKIYLWFRLYNPRKF